MPRDVNGKLFEDRNRKTGVSYVDIDELNTEKQQERGRYYANLYLRRRAEVDGLIETLGWSDARKKYACIREKDDSDDAYPNSFIPLVTPCIEGQTAHMTSAGADFIFYSDNPAHEDQMVQFDAGFNYIRRASNYDNVFKDIIREYLLIGNVWVGVKYAKTYGRRGKKPDGVPKVFMIPAEDILVDGRIKDSKDLQDAVYIIHEIGFMPIAYVRDEYENGDKLAEAIQSANSENSGAVTETTMDEMDSFKLLHVWTRDNPEHNLQLIEMDANGLILRESDPGKPYYEECDNEYPFAFQKMMPIPGCFYGMGDGQILSPMQDIVNKLCDEMQLAARYSAQTKILADPRSDIDPELFDSDPSHIIPCVNPNSTVRFAESKGMNEVVYQMIDFILKRAEAATRYSDRMNGQAGAASQTATASQNEVLQGTVGIQDKKADIVYLHAWAARFSIKIALEKWDEAFWATRGRGKQEMVDLGYSRKMPQSIPITPKRQSELIEKNPRLRPDQVPKFEFVGPSRTADIDFDVEVTLGAGMPHGPVDIFNILQNLVAMTPLNEEGLPEPVVSLKRFREEVEKFIGINLTEQDDLPTAAQILTPVPQPGGGQMQQNPIGGSGQIQPPQTGSMMPPSNLRNTVPGMNGMDKRAYARGGVPIERGGVTG